MTLAQLLPIAAAGASAITLLYLLRMRRRQIVVPFAALWEQVTRESESRKIWRRLRRLLSWLLQLGVLLLVLAALGDPRPEVWLRDPTTVAIVIDHSASMAGPGPDGGTRLDAARVRAQQEIAAMGPADRIVLIAAGADVGVLAPLSSDPTTLAAALPELAPGFGEADMVRALALAEHAVAGNRDPRILVLTDGALDEAGGAALRRCVAGEGHGDGTAAVPCTIVAPGGNHDNLAITAFAARRYPNARDKVEVLAEVRNLGDTPAVVELEVTADGVAVAAPSSCCRGRPSARRSPTSRPHARASSRNCARSPRHRRGCRPRWARASTTLPTPWCRRCRHCRSRSSPTAPTSSSRPRC
ncbi:MAG: VWA domain-containing protein [Nannocystaceae bacterium]